MTELEARIEQNQRDIDKLLEEQKELKKKAERERQEDLPMIGILDFDDGDSRIFINFPKISSYAKDNIKDAINRNLWITLDTNGHLGTVGHTSVNFVDFYIEKKEVKDITELLRKVK